MNYEDLRILDDLRAKGSLTEEEFQREKARLLNETATPPRAGLWGMDENVYIVLMHISQIFCAFVIPLVMWLANKENAKVDENGKNIMNFLISYTIYGIVACFLIVVVVGIVLLIALGILSTIFIIIAAVKSAKGEVWKYPLSIEFLK
ncbi:MAG: DUF4870 domain-containing protein [Dysgonamonadaceae bacterium]|jgi:uncharacterized Tic20 family protein|nr:DUF4870 domain-containing protein [Dysgonamonadaceae bacterium]